MPSLVDLEAPVAPERFGNSEEMLETGYGAKAAAAAGPEAIILHEMKEDALDDQQVELVTGMEPTSPTSNRSVRSLKAGPRLSWFLSAKIQSARDNVNRALPFWTVLLDICHARSSSSLRARCLWWLFFTACLVTSCYTSTIIMTETGFGFAYILAFGWMRPFNALAKAFTLRFFGPFSVERSSFDSTVSTAAGHRYFCWIHRSTFIWFSLYPVAVGLPFGGSMLLSSSYSFGKHPLMWTVFIVSTAVLYLHQLVFTVTFFIQCKSAVLCLLRFHERLAEWKTNAWQNGDPPLEELASKLDTFRDELNDIRVSVLDPLTADWKIYITGAEPFLVLWAALELYAIFTNSWSSPRFRGDDNHNTICLFVIAGEALCVVSFIALMICFPALVTEFARRSLRIVSQWSIDAKYDDTAVAVSSFSQRFDKVSLGFHIHGHLVDAAAFLRIFYVGVGVFLYFVVEVFGD